MASEGFHLALQQTNDTSSKVPRTVQYNVLSSYFEALAWMRPRLWSSAARGLELFDPEPWNLNPGGVGGWKLAKELPCWQLFGFSHRKDQKRLLET